MENIKGNIINHDNSLIGEISFEKTIKSIKKIKNSKIDNYIIPGFIDLHCHGGNGFDTMEGVDSIKNFFSPKLP